MAIINIIAALICRWKRRGAADVAQYCALPDRACLTSSKVLVPPHTFVTVVAC
jgi:hypothetical protein